jgi:hypothetical protein
MKNFCVGASVYLPAAAGHVRAVEPKACFPVLAGELFVFKGLMEVSSYVFTLCFEEEGASLPALRWL